MYNFKNLSIVLLIAAMFASCVNAPNQTGVTSNKSTQSKDPNRKIRIGFSMDTVKEERWQRDRELVEKHAKELGADIEISVADGNDERQAKQVDDLLTKGIDVLVIAPHEATVAASMVAKAKANGVPVVSYDRLVKSDDVDLYVSHQIEKVGEMQARYALEKAPKGNYILVYGSSTDNNATLLQKGQKSILQASIDKGDIKIVAEQNAKEWKAEEALKIVQNALTQNNNDVVSVIASNDGIAGGAIQALKAQSLTSKVTTTGMDAELAALQRIAQGEQTMTVYKPIQPLAFGAVEAAIKLAKGETVTTSDKVKAVNKEIPSLLFEPKVIDKSNLMTVVNDGYQKFDDIFKNVPVDQRPKQ